MTEYVNITKNTSSVDEPEGWSAFSAAKLDVVPDPMVLRTGETFLLGKSGVQQMGLDPTEVWTSIDANLGSLFAFFDLLLTREKIPLIEYGHTFANRMPDLLGPLAVNVTVDGTIYENVRKEVVNKLNARQVLSLDQEFVDEVKNELTAFAWEWTPYVDLPYTGDTLRAAQFLVGGLIFSSYAAAIGADHVIQPKRSRLMLEASAPTDKRALRGRTKESELFSAFKEHCAPISDVRIEDLTGAPSALALILYEHPELRGTTDVLHHVLTLRDSRSGRRYRSWFQELRRAWALGRRPEGEDDAQDVIEELRRRSPKDAAATGGVKADITVGLKPELKLKDVPVELPPWLRGWVVSYLPFKPHRRFLLRLSLAQSRYEDITMHLYRLWNAT
ncbi:MAG TPA: hypothetical protein VK752_17725 [Bryobacteraceae bacterium]|jgi:hypothetical protein|nr:hypothetical protein [Bryobacteraceae bacterium]